MTSKLINQLLYYLPSQIIPAILNLLFIIFLINRLDIAVYGEFTLLLAIVSFIVTILTSWFSQSILYYFPRYEENGRRKEFYYHVNKILRFGFFVLIIIIILLLILNIYSLGLTIYILLLILIMFQSLYSIELAVSRAELNNSYYLILSCIFAVSKFVGVLIFEWLFNLNLTNIVLILVLSYLLLTFKSIRRFLFFKNIENNQISTKVFLLEMFKYGLPVMGMTFCTTLFSLNDKLLLNIFHGSYEVGLFSANNSLAVSALSMVFLPITMSIHPLLMKEASKEYNLDILENSIKKYTSIYFLLGIPILIILGTFNNDIAKLLLGEEVAKGSSVIYITMISMFIWNLSMIGHKGFEIKKNTKVMMKFMFISTFLGIGISIGFIWKFSYIGAALSGLCIYAFYMFLIYFNSHKTIKWRIDLKKIYPILLLSLLVKYLTDWILYNKISSTFNSFFIVIEILIYTLVFLILYVVGIFILKKVSVLK